MSYRTILGNSRRVTATADAFDLRIALSMAAHYREQSGKDSSSSIRIVNADGIVACWRWCDDNWQQVTGAPDAPVPPRSVRSSLTGGPPHSKKSRSPSVP